MSANFDEDGCIQPREWFAVLFGGRLFRSDTTLVHRFTDSLKSICVEMGIFLMERPFRNVIVEDDNVGKMMEDIRDTIESIQVAHYESLHMPLVVVVDDQSLLRLYDDYVEPAFNESAFIYSMKAFRVKEFVVVDEYGQVRRDMSELKPIMDEHNPLIYYPVRHSPPPREVVQANSRDNGYPRARQSPSSDRYYDGGPRPARGEEPHRRPRRKAMTTELVEFALSNVDRNPRLVEELAEEMDDSQIDLPMCRNELPSQAKSLLDLLKLLVLSAENRRAGLGASERDAGDRRRKKIAEAMLKSGLLAEVHDEFVRELPQRMASSTFSQMDIVESASAIRLLLRSFIQLGRHGIFEADAVALWTLLETPVFRGLPARFWRAISEREAHEMCSLASMVTTNDVAIYKGCVRDSIANDAEARCDALAVDQSSRRDHRASEWQEEECGPSSSSYRQHEHSEGQARERSRDDPGVEYSSAYRYDPYDMDESDTSEVYEEGADAYDMGGFDTPTEDDLVPFVENMPARRMVTDEERREEEEERRRREVREEEEREEERRRREEREEEERWKNEQESLRSEQEFERRRHAIALHLLERKRWEEGMETCIAWHDNDGTEPPVSYRTLATRPVYTDLYKPKAPYMRKALVSGAYTDNEHYLDVQFRLMREDMVSPLRDGLYNQKINTEPGGLIPSSNNLRVYPTIEIGALQMRSHDGIPMRIVHIPQHYLNMLREKEERVLKYGQCVVISSDNFQREFHIGFICDRFQEPGMAWQGRLAISFFDECYPIRKQATPIDKSATFALIESPAYLEAYKHVLRVLKKMRKHVMFPLERYLVHMKKNTRLPQYMRVKLKDEDAAEDKELQILYAKNMAEANKKLKEAQKQKNERLSRSESCEDAEAAETPVTTEEGVSEKGDDVGDDGFNSDEEDAFLTGGRHVHPNPKDLESISIRGVSYRVETLEQELKADFLDETQKKAMCYALTSELAIIQGPPGTGKTHIGVEIVMAILENRIKWRMTEPILIVTFSNQALDHFLDKIRLEIDKRGMSNEDTPSVVRLGSRSEHDGITLNCLLGTVMKDYEEDLAANELGVKKKARSLKQCAQVRLVTAVKIIQISKKSIMQFSMLREVMDPNHEMQFRQASHGMCDSNGNLLNNDEMLVSWLLNKRYERRRDLPSGSDDSTDEEEEKQWGGGGQPARALAPKKSAPKKKQKGKETKKEKNERKRQERRNQWREEEDSSDTEDEDEDETAPDSSLNDTNDEKEEADEDMDKQLDEMLKKFNEAASLQRQNANSEDKWRSLAEKYEMNEDWEMEREYAMKNNGRPLADDVEIFSKPTKEGLNLRTRNTKGNNRICVDPTIVRDIREHKQYILSKEALTNEEAKEIQDVRTLPKERRWRLLMRWQENLAASYRQNLDMFCRRYHLACEKYEVAAEVSRAAVLRRALVVGATTTGSAKRRGLVARIAPKVLVVEEAAEVLEAHLLASFVPSIQHAIFIGDQQQLRPSTAVHALAKMANMEVSLFERLIKNGYPYHTLGLQHRMFAPLTKHVVKPFFYKALEDAPSIKEYPSVLGVESSLFFWAHNVAENITDPDSTSRKNIIEAEMCRNLANYILLQGQYKPKEITIIGMYAAQVKVIKDMLQNVGEQLRDVAVETVDSFQGKENRVMILSLVRSMSGGVGFLAIANRITVALTRAQHGMFVIGNFKDIAEYSDMWNDIVFSLNKSNLVDYTLTAVCQQHGNKSPIRVNQDFIEYTPYGGCTERCGYLMKCGHACKQRCHPPRQHIEYMPGSQNLECREQCIKRCQKCNAQCTKACQEACGACHVIVSLDLDCGHSVRCECGARNLAKCKEPCAAVLECGHTCQNKCSVACVTMEQCETGVEFDHPICKHKLVLPCCVVMPYLQGIDSIPACYEKCPERLVCGHKCPLNCGDACPTTCDTVVTYTGDCGHKLQKKCSEDKRHIKCPALVTSDMPHCSHHIKIECHLSRNQNECRSTCKQLTSCGHECALSCGECFKRASVHECSAPCQRDLPCGHRCHGRCGKPCVCIDSCRVRCAHQRCGLMGRERGGNIAYGRQCGQTCALCAEPCDNHCEHRACTKKCYEECDVKQPCSKPCSKMLRCGHGCLGLCGETCPNICGLCAKAAYKTLIERFPDEEAAGAALDALPRLIQMPDCEHVFPYKYVDKCVRQQLEAGAMVLRCPRCNALIEDCKRYIRTTKRLWAEADARKWDKKMYDLEMSAAELRMKYRQLICTLNEQQMTVVKYSVSAVQEKVAFACYARSRLESLCAVIRTTLNETCGSKEHFYWQALISCHRVLSGLVLRYLFKCDELKVDTALDSQPNLRSVMDVTFDRRSRLFPMKEQFRLMVESLKDSMQVRRVGLLVPKARADLIRSHLFYHMEHLHATMYGKPNTRGDTVDLTLTQAATYKRVIRSILRDPPQDYPQKKLEDMMAKIYSDVYTNLLSDAVPTGPIFVEALPEF